LVTGDRGVDVSNYTGPLTADRIAALQAWGCRFVVVQAITGQDGVSWTRQQCQAVLDAGMDLQGYVWAFPGENTLSVTNRLALFGAFPLSRLWLDVEQAGLTVQDVNLALGACDNWHGQHTGIYTGKWFFDQQGWSGQALWADRDLWHSSYDHVADAGAGFVPYGGWTRPAVKQYDNVGPIPDADVNVVA
jgi:hypothetical protein